MTDPVDVSISMSLHLGDLMRETAHLSPAEMGAHMRLVAAAWSRGGYLPADPERLRRLAGVERDDWEATWATVRELWITSEDGSLFHQRTLDEIERAREAKARAVARGRAGGRAPHPTQRDQVETKSRPSRDQVEMEPRQRSRCGRDGTEPPPPPPSPPPDPTPGDPPRPPQGGPPESNSQAEPDEPAGPDAESVRAVVAHYRRHHPRACPSLTSKSVEWRKIRARLVEGSTVADLCAAIDGYHRHRWHVENGQLGLELIMRDASHVAQGLGFANPRSAHPPAVVRTAAEAERGAALAAARARREAEERRREGSQFAEAAAADGAARSAVGGLVAELANAKGAQQQ